ncbi:hypothetical protein C8R46DRAFT_1109396, partial [Mycena filopes]
MLLLHLVPTSQQKTQVDSCRHHSALVDSHRHLCRVIQRPQFIQHAVRVLEARFPHPGLTSVILLPLFLALLRTTAFQTVAKELISLSLSVPSVLSFRFTSFRLLHGLASFESFTGTFPLNAVVSLGRRSLAMRAPPGLPTSVRVVNLLSSGYYMRARCHQVGLASLRPSIGRQIQF